MKKTLLGIFFLTIIYAQDYFEVTIESTGISQLIIFQNSITELESGDEIGVFDSNAILNSGDCSNQTGELLVGAGVWTGGQLANSSIGSVDNCAFGGTQFPGFVSSNPVIVKVIEMEQFMIQALPFLQEQGHLVIYLWLFLKLNLEKVLSLMLRDVWMKLLVIITQMQQLMMVVVNTSILR